MGHIHCVLCLVTVSTTPAQAHADACLLSVCTAAAAAAAIPPADEALDEPPRAREGPIITPTVAKSILGQAALQLAVMAALLGPLGEALVAHGGGASSSGMAGAGAAAAMAAAGALTAVGGAVADVAGGELAGGLSPERAAQYTLVFNSFVLMQLFNQVGGGRRGAAAVGSSAWRAVQVQVIRKVELVPCAVPWVTWLLLVAGMIHTVKHVVVAKPLHSTAPARVWACHVPAGEQPQDPR
jgi:hypothetical protein